jgi:hypothetical protein
MAKFAINLARRADEFFAFYREKMLIFFPALTSI